MDGLGIKISVPTLILYCIYVTAHAAYIFTSGGSMPVWSSIANLTTLAMNSTPTSILKNTSAGISKRSTFRNLVSVQEVEANEQLSWSLKKTSTAGDRYKRSLLVAHIDSGPVTPVFSYHPRDYDFSLRAAE